MKKYLIIFGIIISLLSTIADSAKALSETDALKKQLDNVQDLQSQNALIKNEADLAFYKDITYPEFPLNAFSNEHIRQDFIDGLRFSEKGVIRFNTDIIKTLSYADAYKLMSLFGLPYLAEHMVPPEGDDNSQSIKPYLSNAEYPLLAELRAIDNSDDPDSDRMATFRSFYDKTLTPELAEKNCSKRSHNDTLAVLEILYTISFYRDDAEIANRHLVCFEGFVKQFPESKYITAVATDVYKSLLSSRQLVAANKLQRQYPAMKVGELPNIESKEIAGPSVYRIKADKKTLIQQAFTYKTAPEVIVIAHPYCHFCQYLIKDIAANEPLSKFFKQHSRWIADENYLDHIDALIGWNKEYPMAELDIAYLKKDFTQLDDWGTPAIYFLNDGKVVDKIIGWPEEGQKELLSNKIKKHFSDFRR